jgi:hypothetical protein
VSLVQPSGRGHVTASGFADIYQDTDSFAQTITLQDPVRTRDHAQGFVGGTARLYAELAYLDPVLGFQFRTVEQEVSLAAGTVTLEPPPPPAVQVSVANPIAVEPSTGVATAQLRIETSQPVFLYYAYVTVIQPSGRGHIIASSFVGLFRQGTHYEGAVPLKDGLSSRERGQGFVGGNATLRVEFYYIDPLVGFQSATLDQAVQLTGSAGR